MAGGRRDTPHINLEDPTGGRRSFPSRVRPMLLREGTTGVEGCIIYSLKDGDIEGPSGIRREREVQQHEDVRETLDAQPKRASTTRSGGDGGGRIIRYVNASVGVEDNRLDEAIEAIEVEPAIFVDTTRQRYGCEYADRRLLMRCDLHYFRAEVRRAHDAEMLLVVATYGKSRGNRVSETKDNGASGGARLILSWKTKKGPPVSRWLSTIALHRTAIS